MENAVKLIITGFILLLLGLVLPSLMLLGLLESTLPLNFMSYASSTAGLVVGFIGIALYRRRGQ
jgi:hypothetical protein